MYVGIMYRYICVRMCVVYICMYVRMSVVYICMYICVYVHMYVCVYVARLVRKQIFSCTYCIVKDSLASKRRDRKAIIAVLMLLQVLRERTAVQFSDCNTEDGGSILL